jgi:CubicO group peptidase (beta-lactamase class C family)
MLLVEDGRIALDHPIEAYLPELGSLQVLHPGATRIDDTEPAASPITIRQLTHTSGLSASPRSGISSGRVRRARPFEPIWPWRDDEEAGSAATFFQPGTQWKHPWGPMSWAARRGDFGQVVRWCCQAGSSGPWRWSTPISVPERGVTDCALYVGADRRTR